MGKKEKHLQQMGAVLIGYLHVEEYKYISITLHKTQVQQDQRPHHKSGHTKSNRREIGK